MSNKMAYTVLRGKKYLNINYYEELHKNKEDKKKKIPILVLRNPIPKLNFGGSFHSINFKVSRDIFLDCLVFFGPLDSDKAENYKLRVEVYQSKSNKTFAEPNIKNLVSETDKEFYDIRAGGFFYAPLKNPTLIKNNQWYLIQFMLDGADTLYLEKLSQVVRVITGERGEEVTFYFSSNWSNSKQVPEMKFRLKSIND